MKRIGIGLLCAAICLFAAAQNGTAKTSEPTQTPAMKELLTVNVFIEDIYQVKSDAVIMQMINFSGHAEGEHFKGKILPGAVDTQTILPDGKAYLSARYILEGTDAVGDSCRIYINNEVRDDTPQGFTQPAIVTDSRHISSQITGKLIGKIEMAEECLIIRIFVEEE